MDLRSSSPVVRLAAFAIVLVAMFGGGLALGAAVGPSPSSSSVPSMPSMDHTEMDQP